MGAVCCVAAREKTVQSGSPSDTLHHRNVRCSPTWSFRWDHRGGRVAGEDTSINWFSDGISRNDGSEIKNESAYVSEDGSPLSNHQRNRFQKSPISEGTAVHMGNSISDQYISRNVSMDVSVEQVKGLTESLIVSCPSPTKPSLPSTSFSASPLSSQSHVRPSCSTPSRWPCRSPGHQLLRQVSDSRIPVFKSPSSFSVSEGRPAFPSWSNESGMRSYGGSSDGWSIPGFSEMTGTPHGERLSFDSESFGFNHDRLVRSSSWFPASPVELQTCGVCSKLVTDMSWRNSVVAVLICGHVYHAECLENITPDINTYNPACPVCTFDDKQTVKLTEKALKAEMELKARNKKSKNQVVDSDTDGDSVVFDHSKDRMLEGKGPSMDSSSSGRSSFGKHFLRQHFTFGSKGSRSMLDNRPTRKKSYFWAKSRKE